MAEVIEVEEVAEAVEEAPTDVDAIDDIKPHSMVGDDAFDPVITPDDATVVSPDGQAKPKN